MIAIRSTRYPLPLVLGAAVFTLAGGVVHLREWLDTYRHVPAQAPGSFVVRLGFPVNAAVSAVLAVALVGIVLRAPERLRAVLAASIGFQAASLAVLIGSRVGSVFGWMEPVWNRGADQARAVEIGALVCLTALLVLDCSHGSRRLPGLHRSHVRRA